MTENAPMIARVRKALEVAAAANPWRRDYEAEARAALEALRDYLRAEHVNADWIDAALGERKG